MDRESLRCWACYTATPKRIERECKKCGAAFSVYQSTLDKGQGNYCSRSCARSGSPTRKKSTPIVSCWTCGKRFNKYQAEIKKNVGDKHFCSPACWYSFNQRDNHYIWTGGQDERMNAEARIWRRKVLRRDKHHCRICMASRRLEVHHILPFGTHPAERWLVWNGITLCHDCHVGLRHREMEHAELLHFVADVRLALSVAEMGEEDAEFEAERNPASPAFLLPPEVGTEAEE